MLQENRAIGEPPVSLTCFTDCPEVEYETDCDPDEVRCDCECTCIPRSKVCDGVNDCCGKFSGLGLGDEKCMDTAEKSLDELNCPTSCPDGKFSKKQKQA